MWILEVKHPDSGKPFLIEWDLQKKGPAEGAVLLPPAQFEAKVKEERSELSAVLPTAFANVKHHGTSHANATPEAWLSRSYYKPSPEAQGGPYSVAKLFELFGPAEEKKPAPVASKKEAAPKKEAKK